jgi:hypothetical protein
MKTGRFNPSPSGSGSKYFWDSLESAQRYANLVRKWDPNPVIVNTTARPGLMNGPITMDGMPGYTIPNGSLGQLSYPTVMMRW